MRRIVLTATLSLTTLLVLAPAALANVTGEGLLGETNDMDVTLAGFILIVFFPTFILLASLLQARLEKRKHARDDARIARARSADWHGGW
jgi:peptidoglycan biosynthesis protein MviN/MurJ (putative lipid II flippase)